MIRSRYRQSAQRAAATIISAAGTAVTRGRKISGHRVTPTTASAAWSQCRRGLENSVNVVTAHLLGGGINTDPERSLDEVCATAVAAKIYNECIRYYPFVLGAQPVRMIDLAAFYGRQ